jgi:hypothetical protein
MQIKGSQRKLSVRGADKYSEASARTEDSSRGISRFLNGTKTIIKLSSFSKMAKQHWIWKMLLLKK